VVVRGVDFVVGIVVFVADVVVDGEIVVEVVRVDWEFIPV
jgi:hypothetical protein